MRALQWRIQGDRRMKFKDMNLKQKTIFVLKITVCIISGGMIFPNIMHD